MFADEVMMAVQIGVETRSRTVGQNFTDQIRLDESVQTVVHSGARGARIVTINGGEDLFGGGVNRGLSEKLEHGIALGGGPQSGSAKSFVQFRTQFRHDLNLEYL